MPTRGQLNSHRLRRGARAAAGVAELAAVACVALAVALTASSAAGGRGASQSSGRDAGGSHVSWQLVVRHAEFSPRDTAEPLVYDGKMWLSNGYYHGGKLSRDLWASTDGAHWRLVNPSTPYDGYSELVAYRGKMWAIKGSVWTSTDGVSWQCVAPKTPFGVRGYGECVVFKDRIWQLGSGADVWYTDDGVNWTCATPKAPYGNRAGSAVAVFGSKLWLIAGRTDQPNDPPEKGYAQYTTHNDVWCSEDGASWTRVLDAAPWTPRMWTVAAVYRGCLWLIAGYDNRNARNLGDVWYTRDGVRWRQLRAATAFGPRHEVSPFVFNDSLWVVAGNQWPVQNDVWRLTLPKSWPAR